MSILSSWLRIEADKLTVERIKKIKEAPFASNDYSKIFATTFEINEFKFIKIKVLGPTQVETFDGCKVKFEGAFEFIEIESDSTEINTDFSFSLGIGITEFDIDLEKELIDMIIHEKLESISITFSKITIKFFINDISLLKSIINPE